MASANVLVCLLELLRERWCLHELTCPNPVRPRLVEGGARHSICRPSIEHCKPVLDTSGSEMTAEESTASEMLYSQSGYESSAEPGIPQASWGICKYCVVAVMLLFAIGVIMAFWATYFSESVTTDTPTVLLPDGEGGDRVSAVPGIPTYVTPATTSMPAADSDSSREITTPRTNATTTPRTVAASTTLSTKASTTTIPTTTRATTTEAPTTTSRTTASTARRKNTPSAALLMACKRSVPFDVQRCTTSNLGLTVFDHVAGECRNRSNFALCFTSGAWHSEGMCKGCETTFSAVCRTPPQIGNCTAKEISPDKRFWHWDAQNGVCVKWDFKGGKCLSESAIKTGVYSSEKECNSRCPPKPGFPLSLHPCSLVAKPTVGECRAPGQRADSWALVGIRCVSDREMCFAGPYVFESSADCESACS